MTRPAYTDDARQRIETDIRQAALNLFSELGYREVSMRRLAKELGWSAPALYRYYDNKASLLAAIRAEGFIEMQSVLAAARGSANSAKDAAMAGMKAYIDFSIRQPELYSLMYELDQGRVADVPEVRQERQKAFAQAKLIGQEILGPDGSEHEANKLAHLMWVAVHGLTALNVANQLDLGITIEELIEPLLAVFLNGLQIFGVYHV